ncbi:terminase small subunit [Arsenophonus nasoniae]|uniref:terminase small subunit n=1 Tax=Arsenophonus nasoniae TaxID=638 RepID=UPI00387A0B45
MKNTPKQEAFCQAFIETGNASEAYRRAYNTEKMKAATINRAAKQMLENSKVAARIEELRKSHADRHNTIVDNLLQELEEARQIAVEGKQASAAINATMGKAKLLGNNVIYSAEIQKNKEYLRSILERKQSGEISALQAAQLIEIEGVEVPATLMLEIKQSKGFDPNDAIFPSKIIITGKMTPEEASEAYQKLMG